MPLHTYPMFFGESRDCKHCMLITMKFMHIMLSKFSNINPLKFQTGGRPTGATALDPPLG